MTNTNLSAEQFDDRYRGRLGVVNASSHEKYLEKIFGDILIDYDLILFHT